MLLGKASPQQNGIVKMDINLLKDKKDWFRIDKNYHNQIKAKESLMKKYPSEVSAFLPEGQAGTEELLKTMADYLSSIFPQMFKLKGKQLVNLKSGEEIALNTVHRPAITTAEIGRAHV